MPPVETSAPGFDRALSRARHRRRLRAQHLLCADVFANFRPTDSHCPALLTGRATLADHEVGVIAQAKPTEDDVKRGEFRNFGMTTAAGYWRVLDLLKDFEAERLPIVTIIDTPGADPSVRGATELLAWAISESIAAFLSIETPTVSFILGEGGSGGALALHVADVRLMASDALYSVIAPESCSAILFRDSNHVGPALELLKPWARDVVGIGAVDAIVELGDSAIENHPKALGTIREALAGALATAKQSGAKERVTRRRDRHLALGRSTQSWEELTPVAPPARPRPLPSPKIHRMTELKPSSELGSVLQQAYFSALGASQAMESGDGVLCSRSAGGCGRVSRRADIEAVGWGCPFCGMAEAISADHWLDLLVDRGTFHELYAHLDVSSLAAGHYDTPAYAAQRRKAAAASGSTESLRVGVGKVQGRTCALAISEFGYLGGSLGIVAGERLASIAAVAVRERLPLVTVTCSGGARMQEGTLALMQMAKTNAAMLAVIAANLPHVSILANPCTGGALASYATCATTVLAESRALVAFAGPRVVKLAGLPVDEALLWSEKMVEFGGVDEVVPRHRMAGIIAKRLDLHRPAGRATFAGRSSRAQMLTSEVALAMTALLDAAGDVFDHAASSGGSQPELTQVASETLARLAELACIRIPALVEGALDSTDPRVRANALDVAATLPGHSDDRWLLALDDAHHRVRANAAIRLLTANVEHERAGAVVDALLRSTVALEKRAGVYAAVRVPSRRWLDPLKRLVQSHDPLVASAARLALIQVLEGEAVELIGRPSDPTFDASSVAHLVARLSDGARHVYQAWLTPGRGTSP